MPPLTEDEYLMHYESIKETLMIYETDLNEYLRSGKTSSLCSVCTDIIKRGLFILPNGPADRMIKYIWDKCRKEYSKIERYRLRIWQERTSLIFSVCRSYYLCYLVEKDVEDMNRSLDKL